LKALEQDIHRQSVEIWHHLHQHPELSMQEFQTADYVEKLLREYTQVDRVKRVGKTGVWAELIGTAPRQGEEKILMLRGDMDALPIQEAEGRSYRSVVPGVMHACGHDVHTTSLLASVRILERYREQLPGRIWFFFQPGEEVMGGALTFLKDPDIDFSKLTGAFGIHVAGNLEVGKIRLGRGTVLASSDALHFHIHGVGGHAAHPAATKDAIIAAASLIMQLQTLVSREISATDAAVLSLCKIQGGTKDNIIAGEVAIDGTLRTLNQEIRERLQKGIRRICDGVELSLRVKIDFTVDPGSTPLSNSDEYVDIAAQAAEKVLGPDSVTWSEVPGLAGEDFAYYTDKVPGAFIFIGARTPGGAAAVGHTPEFYTDEDTLRVGALVLSSAALEFFHIPYETNGGDFQ
jgi:amidohydrolase